MQISTFGKPFDGDDFGILMGNGEGETTIHTPAIEEDGTGAALAVVAALLRTGKSKVLAKYIEERGSSINCKLVSCSVHLQGDRKIHSWCDCLSKCVRQWHVLLLLAGMTRPGRIAFAEDM